jgi:hypothetical protein
VNAPAWKHNTLIRLPFDKYLLSACCVPGSSLLWGHGSEQNIPHSLGVHHVEVMEKKQNKLFISELGDEDNERKGWGVMG